MSERSPENRSVTKLPVEVSPERQQEVGAYFESVLEKYGKPADIYVMGKYRPHKWQGVRADFESGSERILVEKIDDEYKGKRTFPKVTARLLQRVPDPRHKGQKMWQSTTTFDFDRDTQELTYRDGRVMLFSFSSEDRQLKPEAAGIQTPRRWPSFKVQTTPPSPEGVTAMLDTFLETTENLMIKSRRPSAKARKLGRRAIERLKEI